MAVTKQTYTASAPWTAADLLNLYRDAFIDAGLMTAWHDEFTAGAFTARVLEVEYDATKDFGTTYYYFGYQLGNTPGVAIASGWDTGTNLPTGTQFLDYHVPVSQFNSVANGWGATPAFLSTYSPSGASNVSLDRYTSAVDSKQSWFVLRQGQNFSNPFTILHKDTAFHPWLDMDKGIISGYQTVGVEVVSRHGYVDFRLQENIRRSLLTGTALRGDTTGSASSNGRFHNLNYRAHSYAGLGITSNNATVNYGSPVNGSSVILPIGINSVNPAYAADYIPICSGMPWSPFTPTALAADFGAYMHYADNTIAYNDRFIVQAGVDEWQVLSVVNNAVVNEGVSPMFLARVV